MLHREVQVNIDVPFAFDRYDEKGQEIPTSGTYDLMDNGGTSIQNGSLVIASEGEMSFTFLTASNATVAINYKIDLVYVVDTVTKRESILFDVVETPLINLVDDRDLFSKIPVLRSKVIEFSGQCTSDGTTTTIIDVSLKADERDWTGARGRIVQGSNTIDFRVSAYARSTGTITFAPAITIPVTDDYYSLRQSFIDIIEQSFSDVRQSVRNKIGLSGGYIDSNVLKNLVTYDALINICRSNIEVVEDKWSLWTASFTDKYDREWEKLNEAYDTDGDGNISDEEDAERPSTFVINIRR